MRRAENKLNRFTKSRVGLLQVRVYAMVVLIMCAYGVIASWRNLATPAPTKYDIIVVFGLAFCSFICLSITVRSPSIGDRVVIGPMAFAFLSWLMVDLFRPPQHAVHLIRAFVWLLWLASLVAGVVVLLRGRRT